MQRNYSTQHMNQNVNFTREAFRQTLDLFLETDTNKSNVTLSARSIEDALGAHRSKAWYGNVFLLAHVYICCREVVHCIGFL